MFKTIIEPFRIKTVEQIKMTTPEQREEMIRDAGYNIFALRSEDVIIDLLTDSGTGAMSSNQWGGVMRGDESYAGSPSFFHFRDSVHDITGFEYIIPTHQGRAAERILFSVMCKPGDVVPNNSHFDTTRANCEFTGAVALDLPSPELADMESDYPFKGDMDVARLRATFDEFGAENIPLVMITVTNNSGGGQPVSLGNMHEVAEICREYDTPLYLDACRHHRERLPHQAARAGSGRPQRPRDRARDVRPGAGLHDERQEGRHRQHRRLPGHARPRPRPPAQGPAHPHRGLPHLRRSVGPRPRGARHRHAGGRRRGLPALPHHVDALHRGAPARRRRADPVASGRPRHLPGRHALRVAPGAGAAARHLDRRRDVRAGRRARLRDRHADVRPPSTPRPARRSPVRASSCASRFRAARTRRATWTT